MNYLIAGLAKSGTTILFSRLQQALQPAPKSFFEPDTDAQLTDILQAGAGAQNTLSKVLIGRVTSANVLLREFPFHVLIHRDPRDQFISMLLYLFYDFKLSGNVEAYQQALQALNRKVEAPEQHSTIALYDTLAGLVGRAPVKVFNKLHQEQKAYNEAFSPFLLRYEDFLDNKLASVENYLGLSISNNAEVPQEYQRVARSKGYGEWKSWLNEEDLDYINKEWGETILSLGYQLSATAGTLSIAKENSVDYIAQFNPES